MTSNDKENAPSLGIPIWNWVRSQVLVPVRTKVAMSVAVQFKTNIGAAVQSVPVTFIVHNPALDTEVSRPPSGYNRISTSPRGPAGAAVVVMSHIHI